MTKLQKKILVIGLVLFVGITVFIPPWQGMVNSNPLTIIAPIFSPPVFENMNPPWRYADLDTERLLFYWGFIIISTVAGVLVAGPTKSTVTANWEDQS